MQVVAKIFHKNSEPHTRDIVAIMSDSTHPSRPRLPLFSLSNDFSSFEFKLMSKVTNFTGDIIRDINPYLENCETETGDSGFDRRITTGDQSSTRARSIASQVGFRFLSAAISCSMDSDSALKKCWTRSKGSEPQCGVICIESKKQERGFAQQ